MNLQQIRHFLQIPLISLFFYGAPAASSDEINPQAYGNFFKSAEFSDPNPVNWKMSFSTNQKIKTSVFKKFLILPNGDGYKSNDEWIIEEPSDIEYSSPLEKYSLTINIHNPSEKQFNQLKKHFSTSHSLDWQPRKTYEVIDFLPPTAQAMYQQFYISNRYRLPESEMAWARKLTAPRDDVNWISRVTNCFTAAYEFLRKNSKVLSTHFVSEKRMIEVFENDEYSTKITEMTLADLQSLYSFDNPIGNWEKLKPGDLIMFYRTMKMGGVFQEVLAHVAISIDYNVIFEKTNAGGYPYRLSFLRDSLTNLIALSEGTEETRPEHLRKTRVVIRRFDKKPLPEAKKIFALNVSPGFHIDLKRLPKKEHPPLLMQESHSAVPDFGMGGTILYESLYKIEEFPLQRNKETDRFEIQ